MKKVAITNQKGGVGKTTTAINLATAVALAGVRTLLVDLDPQANVTSGFGVVRPGLDSNIYAALIGDKPLSEIIVKTDVPHLDLVPSGIDLVGAELELASIEGRESRLKNALATLTEPYQFIFFDCPPSLGLITLNALNTADSVIIPIQCEYYALEGLTQLTRSIEYIRERFNPALQVEGIVFTMYDGRSNLTRQVREEVEKHFYGKTYRNWIPRNVRLAEAPGFGKPGVVYDPQSVGARAYKLLADEFLQNNGIRIYQNEPPAEIINQPAGVA
ncbi:MAG: Sporulation initiation inhibitor protein Soj [Elusimicrobia bacterium]|nr:Sporulation initiation inhibitor protein Soj [Elusimicrobiota bacterium]